MGYLRHRRAPALLLASLLAAATFGADLDRCLTSGDPAARTECLTGQLDDDSKIETLLQAALRAGPPVSELRLPLVDALAAKRPELASERSDLQALALDVRGLAHYEEGDAAASAAAYRSALALDDGTLQLVWYEGAEPRWSASLNTGSARIERAARSFLAAGAEDEAARWVDRASRLGFDPVATPWAGHLPASVTTPVHARPWFKPVPDFGIELINRERPFRLSELGDTVIVLDFWATWCGPCRRELPALQRFSETIQDRDLVVVTVNAGEAKDLAISFAQELGLTLPIGRYDARMQDLFPFEGLPMLVVIDRKGRMRGRWDGYTEGLEDELQQLVKQLLSEREDPVGRELARVSGERPALELRWMRRSGGQIEAVDVIDDEDAPVIVTFEGRQLVIYHSDGRTRDSWTGTPSVRRVGAISGEPGARLWFGFRPGGDTVNRIDLGERSTAAAAVGSPIFDVEPTDDGTLLMATLDGLYEWPPGAAEARRVDESPAVAVKRDSAGVLVLGMGGRLRHSSPGDSAPDGLRLRSAAWTLFAEGEGWGVADAGVTASTSGRLFPGAGRQLAVLTESGDCIVLDLADGAERWRARWPELSDMTAADLDGDGLDELILVGRRRLVVLGASIVDPDSEQERASSEAE